MTDEDFWTVISHMVDTNQEARDYKRTFFAHHIPRVLDFIKQVPPSPSLLHAATQQHILNKLEGKYP